MSLTTRLLPGVSLHPNGASYRVRVRPFPARAGFTSADEANEYAQELRRRKRQGILVPPEPTELQDTLLAEMAEAHLQRLATVGGRTGRPYSPDGLADARKAARPWTGEPVPARRHNGETIDAPPAVDRHGRRFADLPLLALDLESVEQYLELRYAQTPRAAVGEYQSLRAILRLARRRGRRFDPTLLELDPVRRRRVKRPGYTLIEIRFFARHVQEHQQRLFLLGGSLGGRIGELFRVEDAWLDFDLDTLTIPDWACKERRRKVLQLLPEEVTLLREQQLVRSAQTVRGRDGTRLLFPRRHGTPWSTHSGFWNQVIVPSRRRAAVAWRAEYGLDPEAPTPFDTFAPHDLRRSAATLMRELGISPELAASRLGHKDAGHLLLTVYADSRPERLRAELQAIAAEGGIDARLARRSAS